MSEQKLGFSPITCEIFLGRTRIDKNDNEVWTGRKVEMTDSALGVVVSRVWYLKKQGKYDVFPIGGKRYKLVLEEVTE